MKKIITDHLYLRQLSIKDVSPKYIHALNDGEVVQFTGARYIKWNKGKILQYIRKSNSNGRSLLIGIFLKKVKKHIGNIRLFNFGRNHKRVELGIMIFDKFEWGNGYGTESLKAIVNYIFEELKLHRICADYYSVNKPSARIFEKAGFKIEGVFKDHFLLNGKYVDSIRVAKING